MAALLPPALKERRRAIRTYLATWLALLALTAATFGLAFLPLGAFHVPVALLIAGTKGGLIVLFFMHLAEHRGTSRVTVLVWALLLATLVALTAADVATRDRTPRRPTPESSG